MRADLLDEPECGGEIVVGLRVDPGDQVDRQTEPDTARGPGRGWNGASEAGLLEFLRARKPDYVVLFPSWYPSRFFQDGLGEAILRVDLEDNLICGDRTMIVYRPGWGAGVPWKDATSGD